MKPTLRRTKIVATIGPASETPEVLRLLIAAGMDVARLNLSHGSHEDHARTIAHVRAIAEELDSPVTILQDLQGPKVRVGQLPGGEIALLADTLELTAMAKRIARHVQQQAKADPFERERLRITANQALLELLRLARETRRHGPTFGLTFCTAHAEAAASKLGRLAR